MVWSGGRGSDHIGDFPVDGGWARGVISPPSFFSDERLMNDWFFKWQRMKKEDLWLLPDEGLVKYVEEHVTTVHEGGKPVDSDSDITNQIRDYMPNIDILEIEPASSVTVEADYSEFKYCLDYALRRFPAIAKEVPKTTVANDPTGWMYAGKEGELRKYWEAAHNEVLAAFYEIFSKAVLNNDELTTKQGERLIKRAAPLKRESKLIAYSSFDPDKTPAWSCEIYGKVPDNVERGPTMNELLKRS